MHYRPADGVCAGLLKEPQTGSASGERGPISAAQKGHGRDCRGWEVRSSSRRDCKEEEGAGQSFVLFLKDQRNVHTLLHRSKEGSSKQERRCTIVSKCL